MLGSSHSYFAWLEFNTLLEARYAGDRDLQPSDQDIFLKVMAMTMTGATAEEIAEPHCPVEAITARHQEWCKDGLWFNYLFFRYPRLIFTRAMQDEGEGDSPDDDATGRR